MQEMPALYPFQGVQVNENLDLLLRGVSAKRKAGRTLEQASGKACSTVRRSGY
jgi:hypothetical protein